MYCACVITRVVNGIGIATNSIGNTFGVLMQVLVILVICSIEIGISDTFVNIQYQYFCCQVH